MLQQPVPDDYVLATGEAHSVREFVEKSFAYIGRRIEWRGAGASEKGVDARDGQTLIEVDPHYFRPTEVDALLGDPRKARTKLGWHHKVSFDKLVSEMVDADLSEMQRSGVRSSHELMSEAGLGLGQQDRRQLKCPEFTESVFRF